MDVKVINKKLIGFSISFLIALTLIVFASQFIDNTQAEFDQGTYINTTYSGSAVVLVGNNVSGTYTSQTFDAGNDATWNNLSYNEQEFEIEFLFTVDGQADVWKSADSGTTWNLVKDDYNSGDGNGATYMAKNSSESIFILYNQDVWVSNDNGISWTKINDNYNGGESQNGQVIDVDNNDNLIIVEGDEDVWQSTDSGVSFTKVATNLNGGNGNIFGITINSSDAIFVVDGAADVWKSTDSGTTWNLTKDDYNGGNSNGATDMASNSSDALFILHNQDVWQSINSGVNWTLVNDDFNGGSDSGNGRVIYVDENDYIYIMDGSEDVYRSTDSGVTFTRLIENLNGGNGNIFGLTSAKDSTSLTFQVRNCSSVDCSDGNFSSVDLNNMNLVGRYFQYKLSFTSPSSSITPSLYNVTIDYTISNQQPVVSSLSLTPSSPKTINDLTCPFMITDPDVGDPLTANITWYRNNIVYSSITQSVTNGTQASSILDSSNTAKNEEWNCTIIPSDGNSYGQQASEKVTIQNSPPTPPNTSITPTSPITTNDLNVVFNAVSQDNDSDSITYSYEWYKDDVLQPAITGSTVSNGVTLKNEVWKVIVTPNDGEEDGISDESNVTIQNDVPSITSASINPTTAYEITTLTASTTGWSDLDGEPENYIYQWFNQNGEISGATSSTLTGTYFNKSHTIYCNVTPYDSDDYGTSHLTNNVTIQNSLPTLTTSLISELGYNGTDEDLIGSFTYSDDDSDTMANNQTKWYKNSIEQTDLVDLMRISYTNTSADDVWIFSARANDGEAWSSWYNSSITILDVSQTYPILISPSNGTYFNTSNVVLTYTAPNYKNMNCTIFADTNTNPTTPIKNNTNLQGKTTVIYNWINLIDNIYYWKVGCINESIFFDSTTKAFIVDTTYPTTAPTLTQAGVSDSDNDGNIELNWTADPDANTYNIYRSSTQITDAINLTKIASTPSTTWEDNTTIHSNTYWYALTTVDGSLNENKSVVSDSFNATANDTINPRLPTNVSATSLNGITTLYWTKVSNDVDGNPDEHALQYKIWYRQNSTVNLSKSLVNETADYIKIVGQDSCSGSICSTTHSLSSSTQYYYFITTIDDANNENLTLDSSTNGNFANLTATITPPGGGGGGGGGGGVIIETQPPEKECKEDWSCSEWYSCVNDIQGRTCVDVNDCETEINKPKETRPCAPCQEKWQCGDWTPCVNNRETKVCIDKNDCGTEKNKPEQERDCNLDTCSDEIKNYGEVGIDCGGPCKACKASDFITGAAIALRETKGPNKSLLIPTIILLIAFLAIKTLRKKDIKFKKIISALHLPLIIIILVLFILSFFGAKITGLFTEENKTIDTSLDYETEDKAESAPEITGQAAVEFNQIKAKIAWAILLVIINLGLLGFIVKNKFPDKIKFIEKIKTQKIEKEKKLEETEKTEEKSLMEEIEESEAEITPTKPEENNIKEEAIDKEKIKEQDKQEMLTQIKEAYKLDQINNEIKKSLEMKHFQCAQKSKNSKEFLGHENPKDSHKSKISDIPSVNKDLINK